MSLKKAELLDIFNTYEHLKFLLGAEKRKEKKKKNNFFYNLEACFLFTYCFPITYMYITTE